jgi:WD40 repeat protein
MGNIVAKKDSKQNNYLIKSLNEHKGGVNCMEVSNDLSVLATGSDDNSIRLWNIKSDTYESLGVLEGHQDYITWVLIEETFILSASADKTMRKWDMTTCECVIVFQGKAT